MPTTIACSQTCRDSERSRDTRGWKAKTSRRALSTRGEWSPPGDRGEACRGLSDELRTRHPEIPWPAIIGMRNILVHDYFGLNLDEVWAAVERDLPVLRQQVAAMLDVESKG